MAPRISGRSVEKSTLQVVDFAEQQLISPYIVNTVLTRYCLVISPNFRNKVKSNSK